jgi:hypothetical protein
VTSVPRREATEFGDWQVDVTFGSRIDPPLLRADSDADPVLSALAGLMGTNLSLPAEADTRLEELTEDRLIPVGGRKPAARLLEQKLNLDAASITRQVERDLLEHLRDLPPSRFEELCALWDVKTSRSSGLPRRVPWATEAWMSPASWPSPACPPYGLRCKPSA